MGWRGEEKGEGGGGTLANSSGNEHRVKALHNSSQFNGITTDVSNILMMIADGVDIDAEWINKGTDDSFPCTAIYRAAKTGHTRAAKCLVQHGADFEKCAEDGNRPLHAAAAFGNHEVVEYLLSQGADFKAKNGAGQSPWILAFERHDSAGKKCLSLLEKEGAEVEEKETCVVM